MPFTVQAWKIELNSPKVIPRLQYQPDQTADPQVLIPEQQIL